MGLKSELPDYHAFTLKFKDPELERSFTTSYDKSVRIPLRHGIVISLLSWYSAIGLIYYIIPDQAYWLVPLTLIYIGSYFGFIIYATYKERYTGYYHFLGALSNAWAGVYAIYFCDLFPEGSHLILPVLIFIIFFGSYMVRLRWIAGCIAAASYIISYQIHIVGFTDLSPGQVALYSFVAWMTLMFAVLAGRMAEMNNRINYVQRKTIQEQSEIIRADKEFLLQEVHHRVKNNLQVINSLVRMQLREVEGSASEDELKKVQSRVLSMASAHQRIRQETDFENINLSTFIQGLIDNVQSLYDLEDSEVELEIDDNHELDMERCIPIGIILNELFLQHMNASDKKQLAFRLEVTPTTFTYEDSLTTPFNEKDASAELIDTLADQLDAAVGRSFDKGNDVELKFN